MRLFVSLNEIIIDNDVTPGLLLDQSTSMNITSIQRYDNDVFLI